MPSTTSRLVGPSGLTVNAPVPSNRNPVVNAVPAASGRAGIAHLSAENLD